MRKNQASITAAGIAVTRAIESEKPEDERILFDPYARQFSPGWLYFLTSFFIKTGYAERRGPGVIGFLVARERYIDDVLHDFLGKGLQQLVILGAGYDSRAYRFEELKGKIRVFEVDHPISQVEKLARVRKIFGTLPAHVTYVPVDFNTQNLEECLVKSGYNPGLKTLYIWQGVTMYLTAGAVDETLRFVAQHSGSGSAIVFDYLYQSVVSGAKKHVEVSNMRRYRFMSGEELIFGIEESNLEDFLKERGFRKIFNMDGNGLQQAYFTGRNAGRNIVSGYGIALAWT